VSFMSSISGRFLYQFGITAAAAVLVSLLVSFTLTPMMSARLLKPEKSGHEGASRRGFYHFIDWAYTVMLKFSMKWRFAVAILAICVMGSAFWIYPKVKQEYVPADVDEAEFSINFTAPEGTSINAMTQAMAKIEPEVRAYPGVTLVMTSIGGSFL